MRATFTIGSVRRSQYIALTAGGLLRLSLLARG